MSEGEIQRQLNPAAMALADAARLLSAAGGQAVTVEMLEADIAAGAATNADGTLNLVHYAAWLIKQTVRPFDCSTVRRGADGAPNSPIAEQSDSLRAGGSHD